MTSKQIVKAGHSSRWAGVKEICNFCHIFHLVSHLWVWGNFGIFLTLTLLPPSRRWQKTCLALFFLVSRVSLKGMLLQIWNIHEAGPPRKCLSLFKRESLKTRPRKISQLLLVQGFFSCFSLNSSHPSFWQIVSCISVDGGGVFFPSALCVWKTWSVWESPPPLPSAAALENRGCESFLFRHERLLILILLFQNRFFFPYFLFFPVCTATELGKINGDTIFHSLIEEFWFCSASCFRTDSPLFSGCCFCRGWESFPLCHEGFMILLLLLFQGRFSSSSGRSPTLMWWKYESVRTSAPPWNT